MRADVRLLVLLGLVAIAPAWADQPYVVGSEDDPDAPKRDLGPRLVDLTLLSAHEYSDRFAVEAVAVAPNGREVAAVSPIARTGPRAWEVETGRGLKLPPMPERSTAIAYDAAMRSVAVAVQEDILGDRPAGVDVYDLDSGRTPPPLEGADDAADLAFSPDDRVLVAATATGVVAWDLGDGRPVQVLDQRGGADSVSFLSANELMVSSGGGALLMRVSIGDGRVQESWEGRGARAACVSPDGKFVAMGGDDAIRIVDLWGGGRPQIVPTDVAISSLDWGSSGTVLAAGTSTGQVLIFDVRGAKGLSRDSGSTRLGRGAGDVRTSERRSVDLDRGREDRASNPFEPNRGRGGSGDGGGGGDPYRVEPPPEEAAEIVAEFKVLVLDTFGGDDPRTGRELEASLDANVKKLEGCWKREARKNNPATGELRISFGVSPEGEGRGFGAPVTDTIENDKLRACFQDKLRTAVFPPGIGTLDVELTMTLREER